MISEEQVKIYLKYNADADQFARSATKSEKSVLIDDVWLLLNDIVFDLHLINSNLASKEKAKSITESLEKLIGEEFLIKKLSDFASSK